MHSTSTAKTILEKYTNESEYKLTNEDEIELLQLAKSPHAIDVLTAMDILGERITTAVDTEGNTFLHLAVAHNRFGIVSLILTKLKHHASTLCKTVNLKGEIPLRLAHDLSDNIDMINCLLNHSLYSMMKPLTTTLNSEYIILTFPGAVGNPILTDNIKLACTAVNKSRSDAPISQTHLDTNQASKEKKQEITDRIKKLRLDLEDDNTRSLDAVREIIKNNASANCGEYAHLVIKHLMDTKKNRAIQIEILCFSNDDHAFIVIDRAKDSDINDLSTWGPHAVIVDAWSGEVYSPISNNKKLSGYYGVIYDNKMEYAFNFLRLYNPNFHKLKTLLSFSCSPDMSSKDISMKGSRGCLSFFISNPKDIKHEEEKTKSSPPTNETQTNHTISMFKKPLPHHTDTQKVKKPSWCSRLKFW